MENAFLYLDHSATTAVDPRVIEAMLPYFSEYYGNPSSLYSVGTAARRALEAAMASVANVLGAKPRGIFHKLAPRVIIWRCAVQPWLYVRAGTTSSPLPSSITLSGTPAPNWNVRWGIALPTCR